MDESPHRISLNTKITIGCVIGISIVMIVLVAFHAPGINGPWYWKWPWRRLPAIPYWPLMCASATPILLAIILPRKFTAFALLLMMLGAFAMKLASVVVLTTPISLTFVGEVIESPDATSYYVDAAAISASSNWLPQYPQILSLPQINLHTRNKPAGPVAYFVAIIRALGYNRHAAITSGVILGALATLSVPATWWLARLITSDNDVALRAAAMLSLCPGFVLLFPVFDPAYVVFTCGMLGLWHLALTTGRARWSILLGTVLMLTTFVTYNPLVLGAFMIGYALRCIAQPKRLLRHGVIALLACVFAYCLLWMFTGYNPTGTFRQGIANHHWQLTKYASDRPYPWTILFDLTDFALGGGWIVPLLAIACAIRVQDKQRRLVLLCVAQPILVAVIALLQSETARVWNFMLPLMLIPAATELGRWNRAAAWCAYLTLLLATIVIGQNLIFLVP